MTESDRGSTVGSGAQLEQAYRMGLDYGPGETLPVGVEPDMTEGEVLSLAHEAFSHFTESAHYANVVAPELRRLAGYEDSGTGCYSFEPGREHARRFDSLLDSFREGFGDAYYSSWEDMQDSSEGGDA
jgi:hypothetical protein